MRSRDLHDGLDHIGYYSEDIAGTYERFRSFGFNVAPPSHFDAQAFATSAIMLEGTYVSLSGVTDWTSVPEWMKAGMGTGIQAFVLRSNDLDALWRAIGPDGNDELRFDGEVVEISRELPFDSIERPMIIFRVLRLKRRSLPALSRCNFCQHVTPQLMWHKAWLDHPNGAVKLDTVVAVHPAPAELADFYGRLFDSAEVTPEGDLDVDCLTARLRIVTPAALRARYGKLAPPYSPDEPLLAGAVIGVRDLAQTAAFFEDKGVPATAIGDRFVIAADQAYGGFLEFAQVQQPAGAPSLATEQA